MRVVDSGWSSTVTSYSTWWGPRPGPLQEWVVEEGLSIPSAERYKRVRRYYAKDQGRTMLRELLSLMDPAA